MLLTKQNIATGLGLLLVLRFLLLLVFALNPQQDPSVNLLPTVVGFIIFGPTSVVEFTRTGV